MDCISNQACWIGNKVCDNAAIKRCPAQKQKKNREQWIVVSVGLMFDV